MSKVKPLINGSQVNLLDKVTHVKSIFIFCLTTAILFSIYKLGQHNHVNNQLHVIADRQVINPSDTGLDTFVYSWDPRINYARQFLSKRQVEHLISLGSSLSSKDEQESSKQLKTDKVIREIDEKISLYIRMPTELGEDPILMRSNLYSSTPETRSWFVSADPDRGRRVLTFMIFLSTVEGGEICVPKKPIHITPIEGDAIALHHTYLPGEIDDRMIWYGKPVLSGTRWMYIKHIREGEVPLNQ